MHLYFANDVRDFGQIPKNEGQKVQSTKSISLMQDAKFLRYSLPLESISRAGEML